MGNGENNITRKSRRAGNISDSIDGAITRAKLLAVALALAQKFNLLPQQSWQTNNTPACIYLYVFIEHVYT